MKKIKLTLFALALFLSWIIPLESFCLPSAQKKVILITIDTLRPDHLGFSGYKRDTSPNIDRFAEESLVFANAYTPIPWTVPAHISLLSGLHPFEFKIFNNSFRKLGVTSLVTLFKEKNYETAAFVSSHLVSYAFFRQGFDYFDYEPEASFRERRRQFQAQENEQESQEGVLRRPQIRGMGPRSRGRKAISTNKEALSWLSQNYDKDFFLWIHYFDPVFPYEGDCGRNFCLDLPELPQIRKHFVQRIISFPANDNIFEKVSDQEIELIKAKYDERIFCADKGVGEIFEKLKKLDIYDDATIILLSDHGAGFEHYLFHGEILYEEAIKIPLIIKSPLIKSDKKIIEAPVSLLDIYPTLVKKFNLGEEHASFDAGLSYAIEKSAKLRDLFFVTAARRRIRKKIEEKTDSALSPSENIPLNKAVISGNKKLIVDCLDLGLEELYDISLDPKEQNNLIGSSDYKERIKELRDKIITFF